MTYFKRFLVRVKRRERSFDDQQEKNVDNFRLKSVIQQIISKP